MLLLFLFSLSLEKAVHRNATMSERERERERERKRFAVDVEYAVLGVLRATRTRALSRSRKQQQKRMIVYYIKRSSKTRFIILLLSSLATSYVLCIYKKERKYAVQKPYSILLLVPIWYSSNSAYFKPIQNTKHFSRARYFCFH